MRAALYVRVSTDEQAKEGFSIEAQRAILERKADELKYSVVESYIDDGFSAKDMKRPAMQKLFSDLDKRQFDVVLFWRLDRLTRSSKDFHKLTERLAKHQVGIKSVSEPIDTTSAIGRFQLELSVSLAQLERETISERVFFVMEERIRKGLRNGSPAPLGYDLVEKKLVINEEQAKLIRRIYDLYLDGTGMNSIAHTMNREGIPSSYNNQKNRKTKISNLWSAPTIKYILQNPVYIGKMRWNYIDKDNKQTKREIIVDAEHDPILEEGIFNKVQAEIKKRAKGGKKFTSSYIFSSVLKCGRCGSTMRGHKYQNSGKWYFSYKCGGKFDKGICNFPYISENAVVKAFLEKLDVEDEELNKLKVENSQDEEKERFENISRELEVIANRRKKWQLAFANDLLTLEELKGHTEDDRLREEFLKKQLQVVAAHNANSDYSKEEIIDMIKQLRDYWHVIENDKAKKTFVQEVVEYMVINIRPGSKVGQGVRIQVNVTDIKFRI